jgi:hypothetical protein
MWRESVLVLTATVTPGIGENHRAVESPSRQRKEQDNSVTLLKPSGANPRRNNSRTAARLGI